MDSKDRWLDVCVWRRDTRYTNFLECHVAWEWEHSEVSHAPLQCCQKYYCQATLVTTAAAAFLKTCPNILSVEWGPISDFLEKKFLFSPVFHLRAPSSLSHTFSTLLQSYSFLESFCKAAEQIEFKWICERANFFNHARWTDALQDIVKSLRGCVMSETNASCTELNCSRQHFVGVKDKGFSLCSMTGKWVNTKTHPGWYFWEKLTKANGTCNSSSVIYLIKAADLESDVKFDLWGS